MIPQFQAKLAKLLGIGHQLLAIPVALKGHFAFYDRPAITRRQQRDAICRQRQVKRFRSFA